MTTQVAGVGAGALASALIEIETVAARRLRRLRRAPGGLVGIIMNPIIVLVAFGYLLGASVEVPGGSDYSEYIFAGGLMQVGLAGITPTAMAVALDLRSGLVDRLRSLPISKATVLIGHSIGDLVTGLFGMAVVTVVGLALGWRPHGDPLSVLAGFAVAAAFVYAMVWVGIMLGLLWRNPETISSIGGLIAVLFSFLSTGFISSEKMPALVRPIAEWNPVSAVVTVVRQLWDNPQHVSGFAATHSVLVAVLSLTAVLLVAGAISMRRYRADAH
ncbi:ABC transporter permease [Streptomyces aurantiacus]|uniref:ABC transporter permease n=1 Tax=Streptomyces aurantiacus TaxID=47760 RepID=UPI00040762C1|nr:ABC transporter permease [Streptomyces aurantiacus]